jgi:hypothetical protein
LLRRGEALGLAQWLGSLGGVRTKGAQSALQAKEQRARASETGNYSTNEKQWISPNPIIHLCVLDGCYRYCLQTRNRSLLVEQVLRLISHMLYSVLDENCSITIAKYWQITSV